MEDAMNAAFLLCLLFVSPDQKLVDITVYQGATALQSMQLERTPKGLDMYFLKGQQRRKVAAFLVKDDPFFFVADLEGIEGEPEQFDLRQARQGVRPWDSKTEKQELQALGKRIVAVRQGQTIAVTFDGASETFVTQLATAPPPATATAPATASRPGATSQPASTPSSRPAGRTGRTRTRPEPASRPARPASAIAPASSPATSAPASRPAIRTPAVDAAASADPTRQKNVLRTIAEFFDALAGGEASAMGPCYADSVTIAKGSTLLEEQLGLDCKLSDNGDGLARRQDLLDAYAALVASKGKAQWLKGFYSAGGYQAVPAILPVESDGQAIAGSRQGDMAVEVKAFGKKSTYLFRRQESGAWLIVLEQSKY
jgi:hypothetical protein